MNNTFKFEVGDKVQDVKNTYPDNKKGLIGKIISVSKNTCLVQFDLEEFHGYNGHGFWHVPNDCLMLVDRRKKKAENVKPDALIDAQMDIIKLIAKIKEKRGVDLKISYSPNLCCSVMEFDRNSKIICSIDEYIIYEGEELQALKNVYRRLAKCYQVSVYNKYNGKHKYYAEYSLYSPACTTCKMVFTRSALVASEDAPNGCTVVVLKTLHGRVVDIARRGENGWYRV